MVKTPSHLYISGRTGFNDKLNGIYKLGDNLHQNRVYYTNPKTNFVIRWNEKTKMWFIDWRGLGYDDTLGTAFASIDVAHPLLITCPWNIYDGKDWVIDENVKVQVNKTRLLKSGLHGFYKSRGTFCL